MSDKGQEEAIHKAVWDTYRETDRYVFGAKDRSEEIEYATKACERLLASGYINAGTVLNLIDSLMWKDEFDTYNRAQNTALRRVKWEIKKLLPRMD